MSGKLEISPATAKEVRSSCSDISYAEQRLSDANLSRVAPLGKNDRETINTLMHSFGSEINGQQQRILKGSLIDSMQERYFSLAQLSRPENKAAADVYMNIMNNAGFDVSLSNIKQADGSSINSLSIFEHNSSTGMRFNSILEKNGKRSAAECPVPDAVEREKDGTIRATHDLQTIVDTQDALSRRAKGYLDRE